jgi:hypothetical protein
LTLIEFIYLRLMSHSDTLVTPVEASSHPNPDISMTQVEANLKPLQLRLAPSLPSLRTDSTAAAIASDSSRFRLQEARGGDAARFTVIVHSRI